MNKELEALKYLELDLMEFTRLETGVFKLTKSQQEYLNLIKQTLTPPTAEEVTQALSEWLKLDVEYITHSKSFYTIEDDRLAQYDDYEIGVIMPCNLPPHLIEMIGKFYKGVNRV